MLCVLLQPNLVGHALTDHVFVKGFVEGRPPVWPYRVLLELQQGCDRLVVRRRDLLAAPIGLALDLKTKA
jgi:hypothetical protein